MISERKHAKLKEFKELAVKKRLYKAPNRLEFRARQVFSGVDLQGKSLLEIGSGDGIYSIWAKLHGAKKVVALEPEVDGCDYDVKEMFNSLMKDLKIKNVTCVPETIQGFVSQDDEKFDIVLSNSSVNHLDEDACKKLERDAKAQEKYIIIFKKIRSMMKKGGMLLVLDNSNSNFFPSLHKSSPFSPNIDWQVHQAPEMWIALLLKAGFFNPKINWPSRYKFFPHIYCSRLVSYFFDSFFRIAITAK